ARGFGRVTWVGLDPYRSTVRTQLNIDGFWQPVMQDLLRSPSLPGRVSLPSVGAAAAAASLLPRLPSPSRITLAGFAGLYALLFGPVNIWFLRRLRRTVRAWLFVPALSVAMTAGLLTAGHAWGRGHAILNRVAAIETVSGARTGREQTLLGL